MGVGTAQLKKINEENIYRLIYESTGISKQQISFSLGMSLPTITKSLSDLLEQGKIRSEISQVSTGGRPAALYKFNEAAKLSIGVEVLAGRVNVAAVDLYGNIRKEDSLEVSFVPSAGYYDIFSAFVNRFIASLMCDRADILGVTVGIQGIVAPDGEHVSFSKLLSSNDFTRSSFQQGLEYPVSLVHDAEVGAAAELWHFREIRNALVLSLNPYLGSAVIIDGRVVHYPELSSGAAEHMILHRDGELCYCGKRGCADVYCSANAILKEAGEDLDSFFIKKKEGDKRREQIWENFLGELALLIDNVRMVICGDVILGGLLAPYFEQEDLAMLKEKIGEITAFRELKPEIRKGYYGPKAALIGAGLVRTKEYLRAEGLLQQ